MNKETIRVKWEEICFILSEKITRDITEKDFENQVIRSIEKLGWSEFKKEIKRQPVLQLGRKSTIRPDIVIYGPDRKAIIVIEVKRPAEDLAKDGSAGQLKSYMRQMKADFGLLIGNEIRIYYDGILNPHQEPLLLDKITFESKSEKGNRFIAIFNKEDFLKNKYEYFLHALIDQYKAKRNIKKLRQNLVTKETKNKIFRFLKNEYSDYGSVIIDEALKALKIELTLEQSGATDRIRPPKRKTKQPNEQMGIKETIYLTIQANKSGISKSEIINNTGFEQRQVGNALHRLSKNDMIGQKSRGVWIAIKKGYDIKPLKRKPAKAGFTGPTGIRKKVFGVIKKYRRGTSIQNIIEKTKLETKQVRNALHRLTKNGKIEAVKRGVYIALE
jgi:hypothetical protein